jgi:hypothetical protein
MENKKIKISTIVESQIPDFILEEYPLVSELLTEYYRSLESKGSSLDIIQNIDDYIKVNNLSNLNEESSLTSNIDAFQETINVSSTKGFPKSYGIILINDEIILYKSKTNNSFNECVRGFSGISEYGIGDGEDFVFNDSNASSHNANDTVLNLSTLFLKEFFIKVKKQFAFGFENADLYQNLNDNLFLKQSRDFYSSKGSNRSFEILFKVLYGKDAEVILPRDYIISPSNAEYRVTKNLVVEPIEGNLEELKNRTIFQDQYDNIPYFFGTVVDTQKYIKDGKEYYILMLDYDFDKDIIVSGSIFGDLNIHPQTSLIENVQQGSTTLAVDSTIGFQNKGELVIDGDLNSLVVQYNGKTINQFLNCTGISNNITIGSKVSINTYAYGISNGLQIKFRISGVLEETELSKINSYHTNKSKGSILTLGYNTNNPKDNNWIINKSVKCYVSSFEKSGSNSYVIETFDDSGINFGDDIILEISKLQFGALVRETLTISGSQVSIPTGSPPGKKFQVSGISQQIVNIFWAERIPKKYKGKFLSDTLNIYKDFVDDTVYVASSSLPSYGNDYNVKKYNVNIDTNLYNESTIKFSGIVDHGFLTGDAVVYNAEKEPNSLNVPSGIYYVKRETPREIKFSRSREYLDSEEYITFNYVGVGTTSGTIIKTQPTVISGINTLGLGVSVGNYVFHYSVGIGETYIQPNTKITAINNNSISISKPHTYTLNSIITEFSFREPTIDTLELFNLKKNNTNIDSQKLIKALKAPVNDEKTYDTLAGTTGILVNGVEILNYKSNDVIYYGSIESVKILRTGKNYDLINPPVLDVFAGISENQRCEAYCGLEGELSEINIIDPGFNYVDVPLVQIAGGNGFGASAIAKLLDYEYGIEINPAISNTKINLGSNILGFSTYHKFSDGEKVTYLTYNNTPIGGLQNNSSYFVSVLDDFRIKLHKNLNDSLLQINPIDLSSYGVGTHKFVCNKRKKKLNSIVVTNPGSGYKNKKILVPSSGINTYSDTIVFDGHPFVNKDIIYYYGGDTNISGLSTGKYIVTKVNDASFKLSNVGIGSTLKDFYYNTNQYVNLKSTGAGLHHFNYEPISVEIIGKIGISSASNIDVSAKVQPIFDGRITSVYVKDGGVGYGSSEIINYNKQSGYELKTGSGARVTPVVSNGQILDVIIDDGGSDYNSIPELVIKGDGIGAILTPIISNGELVDIKIINKGIGYNKNNTRIEVVSRGSGCKLVMYPKIWTINQVKRLQETNYTTDDDSVVYFGNNKEYGLQYCHLYSPRILRKLIFSTIFEDGIIKYRNDYSNDNSINKYHSPIIGWAYDGNPIYGPYGYTSNENKTVKLIESSYELIVTNNINRPNTTIYPNGYFVEDYEFTGSGDLDEHNGRYCVTPEYPNGTYAYFMTLDSTNTTFDKPVKFPYVIGNSYKSTPIEFNFNANYNQDTFDFNKNNLLRNTTPYNTLSSDSDYRYFISKDQLKEQSINVKSTTKGKVESIKIISGGSDYQVNDKIVFNNSNTEGSGTSARVEIINGKPIVGISQSSYLISDVEFYPYFNGFIGVSSVPHKLYDNEFVDINSLNVNDNDLYSSFNISVKNNKLMLTEDIADASSTGIVTYFYVSGSLDFNNTRENDVFKIGNENIKILNIDTVSSRIRVLRQQNSTVSSAHSAYTVLNEIPRKFYIDNKKKSSKAYNTNREIYINPTESIGIGTIVGVGYTVVFSNPGIGDTSIIIPTGSIYIKNHRLNTGDKLIYRSNGQLPITVYNDNNEFLLQNNTNLIVKKITDDFIGLTTNPNDNNLLFVSPGVGFYHSFVTNYDSVLKGNVLKNTVTVSTASTHNLSVGDNIYLDVLPGVATTIKILYNEYNRRLVVNPRSFSSVDTINDTIKILNHGYVNGEKLLYTSVDTGALINESMYYVVVYDSNRIKLAESYYDSTLKFPKTIKFTNSFYGTLSQINPKIELIRNYNVVFDLSDSSLSEINSGGTTEESFDFEFFTNKSFTDRFLSIDTTKDFKIKKFGKIGIDGYITLSITDLLPNELYYSLVPKSSLTIKNEIFTDKEVRNYNQITFINSKLNGKHEVKEVTSNTFTITPKIYENFTNYLSSSGNLNYYTDSLGEFGSINKVKIISGGNFYNKLPFISGIKSRFGNGAVLIPQSTSIGKINSTEIRNIKYRYSADKTIRPFVKFSTIFRVEPLSTIDKINIVSPGLHYNTSPDLILIDGFTNQVVDDVSFEYDVDENTVSIIKNTKGIYNAKPRVIPINNTNGVGISSLTYDNNTKIVTAYLSHQFSDPESFPFKVGQNVFVEGISVINSSDVGFNSKNYDYSLFTVQNVWENLGGFGSAVQYSLGNYLTDTETPGQIDIENSAGMIIPEDNLPKFEVIMKKNEFFIGENVFTGKNYGKILNFDVNNEYLTVQITKDFALNDLIIGDFSKSQAFIKEIISLDSFYNINSSTTVNQGWKKQTGFLNDSLQKLCDSDYYQYFSYSIKSEVSIDEWDNYVTNLNHTLGFKKFSDLILNSDPQNIGIQTSQNNGAFTSVCELDSSVDVDCVQDFDLVYENYFYIENFITSDEIIFNSVKLIDYTESVGNRVLIIDDISKDFNTTLSNTFVTSFNI